MSAKFLISRKVSDSNIMELTVLMKKLRSLTVAHQPGYISAEALRRADIPGESMLISTYCSMEDWDNWVKN